MTSGDRLAWLEAENAVLARRVDALTASRSWRITAPFRAVRTGLRHLSQRLGSGAGGRGLAAAARTAFGRLVHRLRRNGLAVSTARWLLSPFPQLRRRIAAIAFATPPSRRATPVAPAAAQHATTVKAAPGSDAFATEVARWHRGTRVHG